LKANQALFVRLHVDTPGGASLAMEAAQKARTALLEARRIAEETDAEAESVSALYC
jgi:hypothetical protein